MARGKSGKEGDTALGGVVDDLVEILDCVCGSDAEVEPCPTPTLLDQLRGIEERIAQSEGSRDSLADMLAAPLAPPEARATLR